MKMTIRTKRKYKLCPLLKNNNKYEIIAVIHNDLTNSGISVIAMINEDSETLDSNFFRMNSIKINK